MRSGMVRPRGLAAGYYDFKRRQFIAAVQDQRWQDLERLLAADVAVVEDTGTSPSLFGHTAHGRVLGVEQVKRALSGRGELVVSGHSVNGALGAVVSSQGYVVGIIILGTARCAIVTVWIITNPAKLSHWNP